MPAALAENGQDRSQRILDPWALHFDTANKWTLAGDVRPKD